MNDLVSWSQSLDLDALSSAALSEAECGELFELMGHPDLAQRAMSAEMADGYLTACVVGQQAVPVAQWLAVVLGQAQLPLCADPARQERVLHLLLRRYCHVRVCTAAMPTSAEPDGLFLPLTAEVDESRRISPYRRNAQGLREGDWELKDWAEGFRRAMFTGKHWAPMLDNRDAWALISPIVLFQSGFNPDKPDLQIDQRPEMLAVLVRCIYEMRQWWQAHALAQTHAASAVQPAANGFHPGAHTPRALAKVGRNEPCPCGSGQKYKKCCGAA